MSVSRMVNRLLAPLGLALVDNAVLYDWQRGKVEARNERPLPENAADYLQVDNERLGELRRRYAAFEQQVSTPIVWTDEYVQSNNLQTFRGDNCYVWQSRDPNCAEINYCLSAYYLQVFDRLNLLAKLDEDGLFGAHTYTVAGRTVSRDLLDSVLELSFLEEQLVLSSREDLNILDIGAGYGRLAYRAVSGFDNIATYLCTDAVPESTFLSEYYVAFRNLQDRVAVVPLDEIEDRLRRQNIDLAINIHSFSECSLEAIDWWLARLADNRVRYLFIVPNAADHGGEKLALNSGEDFSYLVERYGYRLTAKAPKYGDPLVQKYGVSPTWHYLYRLESS